MIRTLVRNGALGLREDLPLSSLGDLVVDQNNVLWIDVQDPTEADLAILQEEFGFHELAMEDVSRPHQRPKIDEYEGYYFVVFYAAGIGDNGELHLNEVDLFVGRNYLVSVHHRPIEELEEAGQRWQRHSQRLDHGVGTLLYAILDAMVDSYFPVLDQVVERSEELEDRIFERNDPAALQEAFALKKDLLALRRVLAPQRDVLNHFLRLDMPLLSPEVFPYFQDVYDHLLRLLDSVDLYRDLVSSALEAHLSATSNTLNAIMKRLTALTVVLMVPTLIAGIYGMNFEHIPELHWDKGYLWALGLMAGLSFGLTVFFRLRGWL